MESAYSKKAGLIFFAVLVIAAPLLYGAVDRVWQAALLVLFGIALIAVPLRVLQPSRIQWMLAGGFVLILVCKEILGGVVFGVPAWRTTLMQDYGLHFPAFGNPVPVTAVELMFTLLLAALWMVWVRGLAGRCNGSAALPLILLVSATVLGVVSLLMKISEQELIYGVRLVRGWQQFGPFPNRNHTACVLAMGLVLGVGCLFHFFKNKNRVGLAGAGVATLICAAALFESKSRGALVAALAGLLVLLMLHAVYSRRKSGFAIAAGFGLLMIAGVLFTRADALSRLLNPEETDRLSTTGRIEIWQDTLAMWADTPVLGQGLGTFRTAFPFYKTINLGNNRVLHPESGWLLWLTELGALPLLMALGFLGLFLWDWWKMQKERERGFSLRAAGMCAFFVLMIHSLYDVPAGRWAAGAFGLAALALSSPLQSSGLLRGGRLAALAVLLLGGVWVSAFVTGRPGATSAARERVLTLWTRPSKLSVPEIDRMLRVFPADPELHQIAAFYKLADPALRREAYHHFSVINRLLPDAWILPQQQAMLAGRIEPAMAFSSWALAIERAGDRAGEIFMTARGETRALSGEAEFWAVFLENNPRFLTLHAHTLPKAEQSAVIEKWMETRGGKLDLAEFETENFYSLLQEESLADKFAAWRAKHTGLAQRDHRAWATVLQRWGQHAAAWQVLAEHYPEPAFTAETSGDSLEKLARQNRVDPTDWVNAQKLVHALEQGGRGEESDRVVSATAALPGAPEWFRLRAAHAAARAGRFSEAVAFLMPAG